MNARFGRHLWTLPLLALGVVMALTIPSLFHPSELRNDFSAYFYAARVDREAGNPYDIDQLAASARADGNPQHIYPYLYPPLLLRALGPLASASAWDAQKAWLVINLAALAMLFVVLAELDVVASARERRSRSTSYAVAAIAMLVLFFAIRRDLRMGQINILVTLVIACGLHAMARGRWAGGALLGVAAAIKVLPIILVVHLVARRSRRALVAMLVTVAAFAALALVTMKHDVASYLTMSRAMGYGRTIATGFAPDVFNNLSFSGFFCRFFGVGSPLVGPLAMACWLSLVALGVAFRRALTEPRNAPQGLLYATCLMIMPSPVVWLHHWVYLLPAACGVVSQAISARATTQRRAARVLLGVLAASAMQFDQLYIRLFGERLPTWTQSVLIPNTALFVVVMIATIWSARLTVAPPPENEESASPLPVPSLSL